jgi:hypothetical protein
VRVYMITNKITILHTFGFDNKLDLTDIDWY